MKRIRHFSMSIALLLVLVITLGIGTAYAWFTDTKSGSGSIQFGKIEINVTSNGSALSNNTFNKTNLLPGDSILDYDVIANKTADSQPFYFRVELSFSVDSSISSYADTLNSLLTAENIGNGSNFVKDDTVTDRAVFYYGTADALTEVTNENPIVILDKDKFTIPTTLTQLLDYAQYNEKASLSITVIALQSVNMTGTMENFKCSNICVYFGSFPQSLKEDDVTITSTTPDANGYYLGSDGEKYAKQRVISNASASAFNVSDEIWQDMAMQTTTANGTKMIVGQDYYFKVEPIKWRLLSTADGAYTLVCDSVLSALAYQPNYVIGDDEYYYATDGTNILTDNGSKVYANNYKWSNLRSWLNNDFYDKAFTSDEQDKILTTEVDNSISGSSPLGEDYAIYGCENTFDKVYAFNCNDPRNDNYGLDGFYYKYGLMVTGVDCYWATTDYAKATGVATITQEYIELTGLIDDNPELSDYYLYFVGSGYDVWMREPVVVGSGGQYCSNRVNNICYGLWSSDGVPRCIYEAYLGAVPAMRISI